MEGDKELTEIASNVSSEALRCGVTQQDLFTEEQYSYVNSLPDDTVILKLHLLHQLRLRDIMEKDRDAFEAQLNERKNTRLQVDKDFECGNCGFSCNTLETLGWHKAECKGKV